MTWIFIEKVLDGERKMLLAASADFEEQKSGANMGRLFPFGVFCFGVIRHSDAYVYKYVVPGLMLTPCGFTACLMPVCEMEILVRDGRQASGVVTWHL